MSRKSLRLYQSRLVAEIEAAWASQARNVCAVMPTGAGKTVVFSHIMASRNCASVAIAHRNELVAQMSCALAREGVRHRVIGPASLQRECTRLHMDELGTSYYHPSSHVAVAGVDTLVRMSASEPWFHQVGLWVCDEQHHLLRDNKWGRAIEMFPNAIGLGVTATPTRADGKGLGRHADGVADVMVQGPSMRDLIEQGFLTRYRIFAPPSDLDLSRVATSASGDFSPPQLRDARHKSHITGDVVQHYLRIAPGKLGVTFDVDVESAEATKMAFLAAGVPAEVITGETPPLLRADTLRRFRRRELLQIVSVDILGEGFDLPAIEVISMARPTQSFSLYAQQFGRALRPLEGKTHAIILDHVGNVERHGLPDAHREWTLNRRERASRNAPTDVVPVRTCLNPECLSVYERVLPECPFCGHVPQPAARSAPEFVDGDLGELDEQALARMRGDVTNAMADVPFRVPDISGVALAGFYKNHAARRNALRTLADTIALWAGWQRHLGRADSESYRRFYHRFGTDMGTALTASAADAEALSQRIRAELDRHNIIQSTL